MPITKGNFTQPSATGQQSDGTAKFTFSHTHTGTTNALLTVVVMCDGANTVNGVTYNGVAMTLGGSNNMTTPNTSKVYMFYLANPSTGANNVVVTMGGNFQLLRTYALSFTGAQAGRIDNIPNDTTSPLAYTFTGTTANSWLYGIAQWTASGGITTINIDGAGGKEWTLAFTWTGYASVQGPYSSGSHTLNSTWDTGGTTQAGLVFEIKEAGGTPVVVSERRRCIVVG